MRHMARARWIRAPYGASTKGNAHNRGTQAPEAHTPHRVKGATWMVTALRQREPTPIPGERGDADAFAQIYRQYMPLVEGICRRMLRDRDLVPDLVHDVFVSAWQSMPAFRTGDPVGPWLKTITRRRCIDQIRRESCAVQIRPTGLEIEQVPTEDIADGIEDALDARDALRRLEPALRLLTRRQRRAVIRVADGWSHREIAAELDVQLVSARALVHRAREKIRAAVDEMSG